MMYNYDLPNNGNEDVDVERLECDQERDHNNNHSDDIHGG